MAPTQPISELDLTTYEVSVPMDLSVFDSIEDIELTLVETVAQSIITGVDDLDEDDVSYVATQVSYDEDGLLEAYENDDVGIATVQTRTDLAVLDDDE